MVTGENGSFASGGVDYDGDARADMAVQSNAGGGVGRLRVFNGASGALMQDFTFGEPTDILVTDAYRWAFERGERYGMAAAYGTIIFLILLLWTVFGTRVVRRDAES